MDTVPSLSRTLILVRDHLGPAIADEFIADALLGTRVVLVGDQANLASESAQHALVTAALLCARWGASVELDVPRVALEGWQAPLSGQRLEDSLSDALADLIPRESGSGGTRRTVPDIAILVGDSRWAGRAARIVRMQADAWSGTITSAPGSRWIDSRSPLGPLAAAGLAAGEAFKLAVTRLKDHASDLRAFEQFFAPIQEATVALAPPGTPIPTGRLGEVDCISGGAIIQAALYALWRIRDAAGQYRVIDPEHSDLTNLNRYALLRRSRVGMAKAVDLAQVKPPTVSVEPMVARYDSALRRSLGNPAPAVLVGVDDIPTRWEVQRAWPAWLGVGATSHYSSLVSYHVPGAGCAWCFHSRDDTGPGLIPTVSFVSHWAGLWLASLLVLERMGLRPASPRQSVYITSLRADSSTGIWFGPVPKRADCMLGCASW